MNEIQPKVEETLFNADIQGTRKDTEIDVDAFAFVHTCPRCKFPFNDKK